MPKQIDVVGAVIVRDGLIFARNAGTEARWRGNGSSPGGKLEAGESAAIALEREILEELDCVVQVGAEVTLTSYEYEFAVVNLRTFYCELIEGEPILSEHESLLWVAPDKLDDLDWAPADIPAVKAVQKRIGRALTVDLNDLDPFGQDVGFGYLDRMVRSPQQFQPHLILNTKSDSMLRALRRELRHATSFTFSVAFVSPRAIALLKQELIDFKGVGRIITSDYLGFNSPNAFAELLNLTHIGIDVRLHNDSAFHPKGYVFHRAEGVTAILGSSNLTESALASNHEWNLRVSVTRDSDLADQFTNLLDTELFESSTLTQEWIDLYAETYVQPSRARLMRAPTVETIGDDHVAVADGILPNRMQVDALASIARVRAAGHDRALIISATGTGKTMLSALDVRAVNPSRMLFIAHREQILDRAMREFHRVLGGPLEDFGKFAGATRQGGCRYVFATVQTLSQSSVLDGFDSAAFDYILIDEVHRAGAASFGRVLDHFKPAFLLGMTATPERGDGESIFEIFNFNVPYEIRLRTALELDMLSPFHYYGSQTSHLRTGGDVRYD